MSTSKSPHRYGVFADNRKRPIHRWYPFVEGYSSALVERALEGGRSTRSVFDPFGGSGTTALTAATNGIDSSFTEANAYMAWVADVKVNQAAAAASSPGDLFALSAISERLVSATAPKERGHPLLMTNANRDFFPEGTAERIIAALEVIDGELCGPVRDLARLAVATSIVPSSNMLRRTDLRRRRPSETAPASFPDLVVAKVAEIVDDVRQLEGHSMGTARNLGNDARGAYSEHDPFTLIVTSPPYLNGTNYGRNTKLELLALGLIESEAGLEKLRTREVTAGINNVAKRNAQHQAFPEVEEVAGQLDDVAYDRRIPSMVRGYFSDMHIVFEELHRRSADNAEMWLDIGDSRYSGVAVPTHTLLTAVANRAGWDAVSNEILRVRRSYDGSHLSQSLIRMERRTK